MAVSEKNAESSYAEVQFQEIERGRLWRTVQQYRVDISNRFAVLENLDTEVVIKINI
jgi:hypothetical protein